LQKVLAPFREGRCPVWIEYRGSGASAMLELGEDWRVHPTDALIERLRELGAGSVLVEY
jgi:DNA polymerase-3 subunit alpha